MRKEDKTNKENILKVMKNGQRGNKIPTIRGELNGYCEVIWKKIKLVQNIYPCGEVHEFVPLFEPLMVMWTKFSEDYLPSRADENR